MDVPALARALGTKSEDCVQDKLRQIVQTCYSAVTGKKIHVLKEVRDYIKLRYNPKIHYNERWSSWEHCMLIDLMRQGFDYETIAAKI